MEMTANGNTPSELQEKLSKYQDLCDQREKLADQLRRVEAEKETVSQRIYEKVRGGYQAQLESVVNTLDPLKDELETFRREVDTRIDEVDEQIRAREDMISEAEFRRKVGEYDEETFQRVSEDVRKELEEWVSQRRELEARLESFDRRRNARDSVEPSHADAAPAKASAPAFLHETPEPEAPRAHVENPQDWFGEIPSDGATPQTSTDRSPVEQATALADPEPTEDPDPLAALADPSPDTSGMASLVMTDGSHEGRVIPLLPMTMSIGREHDNNIELKDPDVARYHARIVHENGGYSIEDMESSTGTFVNGEKTITAPLSNGDRIKLGGTELLFTVSH